MPNGLTKLFIVTNICILFLSIVYFLPTQTRAQTIDMNYAISNELNVNVSPTHPRPNEDVNINLTLYTNDLMSADINWYKNGKLDLSGKGETRYSFRAGPAGTTIEIRVEINFLDGAYVSKKIAFNPANVDMVWEANSYVPPFYKGKALYPRQGTLKIVAIPEFITNGQKVSPANLVYEWSNNVKVYQSQSGYGKNILILNGSLLGRDEYIKVLVTNPLNNAAAQNFLTIKPTDNEIVFYQNDPYYGHVFDSAIANSFNLIGSEVQVLAAPYYFTKENSVKYSWRLNNQTIPDLTDSMTAIFRKPEKETGQSTISLQVTNPNRLLQEASANLTMKFKN